MEYNGDFGKFHCLCCGGICGLPNWAAEQINVVGNLAERDYSVQSVADQLLKLLEVAPSLNVKVHCGADHEESACIATVIAKQAPMTAVLAPEIRDVPEIPQAQMERNMVNEFFRAKAFR